MEYHILIAWNKANINEETIENVIREKSLNIIKHFKYSWDEALARENYAAFYGEKLENIQYKVDHCGEGEFEVYIIRDDSPFYDKRKTSSGIRTVNINLFDLKTELRNMTGGGHLIHASDTNLEADLNCMSLFGMTTLDLFENYADYSDSQHIYIRRNITGVNGWDSWDQLLDSINKLTPYVVLRNYDTITSDEHGIHGDTDLLVGDFHTAVTIAVARKEAFEKNRVLYSVLIKGVKQLIDFRHIGDGYYCKSWEQNMLAHREQLKDTKYWILNNEDYLYSLLYHILVHKPFASEDYLIFLKEKFGTTERDDLIYKLKEYMSRNSYDLTKPEDNSVFIHPDFFAHISIPIFLRIINYLKVIKYKKGGYERENVCSSKVSKVFYRGYYMGISILRKIKAGVRKMFHH